MSLVLGSEYPQAQNPQSRVAQDATISARVRTECLASGAARTALSRRTGTIRFVGTEAGRPIPHPRPADAAGSPETAARAYLENCGSLFGLRDHRNELAVIRSTVDRGSRSVVRFQQMHRGVPIVGAELVVQFDRDRNILAAAGETLPQPTLDTSATMVATGAMATALDVTAKAHGVDRASLRASVPELWIYSPALLGPGDGPAVLVWRTEVTAVSLQPIRELVLVDASRGSVALRFNQVETVRNRNTHTAHNSSTLPGTLVCVEANLACEGGDADAQTAHVYAGDTYDFYLALFGRDSLDDAGRTLISSVHVGPVGYRNAFWDGNQVAYGDGFSHSDDVVGHELTHGVTQYTSNLFYYYQSGAINESLSDLFGEIIDLTNLRGNDSDGVRWQIGEDLLAGLVIRNMQNPPMFGDPDRMTSALYDLDPEQLDNGGVHSNSGINNKAASLMADGGTFNGRVVSALGLSKVARIYYEVQTNLLTSGSDYADLHDALYQGCSNLVGTAFITSFDCQQVRNATLAVEMNLQPVPGFNPDAPLCPSGHVLTTAFFDDIESGGGRFLVMTPVGTPRWFLAQFFARSGVGSLYGDDFPGTTADSAVAMATSVALPANAYLHFAHAFGFEAPNFDGGVLEYSTTNGLSWVDAQGLFEANGYRGTIAASSGNPLAGRQAFVGASHGYISSRLNLSSLAGQNVRFRWRMGLDSGAYDWGWWVDDVRIYTCATSRVVSASPSHGFRGHTNFLVSLTGENTHFVNGQTVANFGSQITVNGLTVVDSTHAVASVTIGSGAPLGLRTVTLTTGITEVAAGNVFTVLDGAAPQMAIDTPRSGFSDAQPLAISGWAIDQGAATGSGVDAVHIWAFPTNGGVPTMIGSATYGHPRPDIAAQFGSQFVNSGWSAMIRGLPPGSYSFEAHAHSTVINSFNQVRRVSGVIRQMVRLQTDTPSAGAQVAQPFTIAGWALDGASTSGSGVDALHVWGYPSGGSSQPVFFGAATYGTSRSDVGTAYGSQFTHSGFTLSVSGVPTGTYSVTMYVRSTATGQFEAAQSFSLTVVAGAIMAIDSPVAESTVSQPFDVTGWAIDRGASTGPGVDAVHVWAYKDPGSNTPPIFVGAATYGLARPDVGNLYGSRFTPSGYALRVRGLTAGRYSLAVFSHSTATGTFNHLLTRLVTVEAGPRLSIDAPANGSRVGQALIIGGWALDTNAPSGSGMDAVHVWAYPNPGSGAPPIFLGAASYGGVRADVGAYFGAQFTNSGYNLTSSGLAPGVYQINVFGHSTVTGTFNIVQSVTVTVDGS